MVTASRSRGPCVRRRPGLVRKMRQSASLALAAAVLGLGLAAGHAIPASSATAASGSAPVGARAGCATRPQLHAPTVTVPVKLVKVTGGVFPTVSVCLGKRGPFPFVVDTGSSRSIIDTRVARSLRLPRAGVAALGGSGCATSGALVRVPALQAGDLVIARQAMVRSGLSDWGGAAVDGVLGSDVLGRFNALRLDLPSRTLTMLGSEGPAPKKNTIVIGQPHPSPLPSPLSRGTLVDQAPLTIVQTPGTVSAFVQTTVAGHAANAFVVDSGAPRSTIDRTAGFTFLIKSAGTAPAPAGIGCSGTVSQLDPAPVSIGSTSATPSMLAVPIAGQQRAQIVGYLGLDVLGLSGSVIVDYAGAQLAFVSG